MPVQLLTRFLSLFLIQSMHKLTKHHSKTASLLLYTIYVSHILSELFSMYAYVCLRIYTYIAGR